jgi:hypothetical protein
MNKHDPKHKTCLALLLEDADGINVTSKVQSGTWGKNGHLSDTIVQSPPRSESKANLHHATQPKHRPAKYTMPTRPLSSYNLFFQVERENILKDQEDQNYRFENLARVARNHYIQKRSEQAPRKHRRSHGKISFAALARTVANKWKKLDNNVKMLFEQRAAIEMKRYEQELSDWTNQRLQNVPKSEIFVSSDLSKPQGNANEQIKVSVDDKKFSEDALQPSCPLPSPMKTSSLEWEHAPYAGMAFSSAEDHCSGFCSDSQYGVQCTIPYSRRASFQFLSSPAYHNSRSVSPHCITVASQCGFNSFLHDEDYRVGSTPSRDTAQISTRCGGGGAVDINQLPLMYDFQDDMSDVSSISGCVNPEEELKSLIASFGEKLD